jgi:hypothetical protein
MWEPLRLTALWWASTVCYRDSFTETRLIFKSILHEVYISLTILLLVAALPPLGRERRLWICIAPLYPPSWSANYRLVSSRPLHPSPTAPWSTLGSICCWICGRPCQTAHSIAGYFARKLGPCIVPIQLLDFTLSYTKEFYTMVCV